MESTDKEMVEKISRVSRISIKDKDKDKFLKEFLDVLQLFKSLEEAEVEDCNPAFHAIDLEGEGREDVAVPSNLGILSEETKEDGFIKVPKI